MYGLPANIGHAIILLILDVLVLVVLVHTMLVCICLRHGQSGLRLRHQHLLLLLIAHAIIGDYHCLDCWQHLGISQATGFDFHQPQLPHCLFASVFILVVLLPLVACRVLGVPLLGFISLWCPCIQAVSNNLPWKPQFWLWSSFSCMYHWADRVKLVAWMSKVRGLGAQMVWKWKNRSPSGRIGAIGNSVIVGVNVVFVKYNEAEGNWHNWKRYYVYILLISCDHGHMDSKLDLGDYPINFATSVGIANIYCQLNNESCWDWHLWRIYWSDEPIHWFPHFW